MELEYEIEEVIDEESKSLARVCPTCGLNVNGNYCMYCKKHVPTEKYYDQDFDDYFNKLEKEGADFSKSLDDKSQWVDVGEGEGSFT